MTRRGSRRWLWWALGLLVLVCAAIGGWLVLHPRSGSSRVAWSFQPTVSKDMRLQFYPRKYGGVFVVDHEGHFYALDAQGKLLNRLDLASGVSFWEADVSDAGGIYVGNSKSEVYALDQDGKLRWKCSIADLSGNSSSKKGWLTAPRVGPDGLIYAAKSNGEVAVLDPTGKIVRRFDAGCKLFLMSIPAVAANGSIYLVSHPPRPKKGAPPVQQQLLAYAPDGKQRWSWTVPGHSAMQYDVAPDGTIYVVAHQDKFYALDPGGKVRWSWVNPDPLPAGGWYWQWLTMSLTGEAYVTSGSRLGEFTTSGKQLLDIPDATGDAVLLGKDGEVYCQQAHDPLRSRLQRAVFWFKFNRGLPANINNLPMEFYSELRLIAHGKSRYWSLPDSVTITAGPGSDGEFYGSRTSPGATIGNSSLDIVRIDLVDR